MLDLLIVGSENSPKVEFSKARNCFKISGNSKMDDAKSFYTLVINWLKDYSKAANKNSKFEFQFLQLNQASLKMMLFLFQEIKSLQIDNEGTKVVWYYPEKQVNIKEIGQDISSMTDLHLKYVVNKQSDSIKEVQSV